MAQDPITGGPLQQARKPLTPEELADMLTPQVQESGVALLDEARWEQAFADSPLMRAANERTAPTVGQYLGSAAKAVPRALAQGLGSTLRAPSALVHASFDLARGDQRPDLLRDSGVPREEPGGLDIGYHAGKAIDKAADALLPHVAAVERYRPQSWTGELAKFGATTGSEAVGSALSFMGGGALGRGLGLSSKLTSAALGAAQQSTQSYEEARASGAGGASSWAAWMVGGGAGLSEAFGVGSILDRVDKASGGGLKRALIDAAKEGGEEALQEFGQQAITDAAASVLYDHDREVLSEALRNGGAGAFAGVIMSLLGSGASGLQSRRPMDSTRAVLATPEGAYPPQDAGNADAVAPIRAPARAAGTLETPVITEPPASIDLTGGGPPLAEQEQAQVPGEKVQVPGPMLEVPGQVPGAEPPLEEQAAALEGSPLLAPTAPESASEAPSSPGVTEPVRALPAPRAPLDVPAQMPKGAQLGTDLLGNPIYSKEERGDLKRPDVKGPPTTQIGIYDEAGSMFEADAGARDRGEPAPEKPYPVTGQTREVARPEGESVQQSPPASVDDRLRDPATRAELQRLGKEAGWDQEGGRVVFSAETENERRAVVSRTNWVPNAPWWKGKPNGVTAEKVRALVKRATSDKPGTFTKAQRRTLEWLLEVADSQAAADERGPAPDIAQVFGGDPAAELEQLGDAYESDEGDASFNPDELGSPKTPGGGVPVQPAPGETQIGATMAGTLGRTGKGATDAPTVIRALAAIPKSIGMNVPIRRGRIGSRRGTQGIFKVRPEVIRIQVVNDIAVAAHEVAHAFEKGAFGLGKGAKAAPKAGRTEIEALGRSLYPKFQGKQLRSEGFAEYVRLHLTNPTEARAKAPVFDQWWEGTFLPSQSEDVQRAFAAAQKLIDTWRHQGSRARVEKSIVDTGSPMNRIRRAGSKLARFFSFEAQVDMLGPLANLSKEAGPLPLTEDPFVVADALRLTHDARTERMVSEHMIDIAGNPVGPSLRDALKPVRGRKREFTMFLAAKRAQALWSDPKHPPRNPGLSKEDAEAVVQELSSPAFDAAAQAIYDWNEGVLDYMSEASPALAEVVQKIRDADPGSYVPLQRVFEEYEEAYLKGGSGASAKGGRVSSKLHGSGRQLKDLLPELVAGARARVLAAHQRMVIDRILAISKQEGFGHLVEGPLPKDRVPMSVDAEQAIEQLEKLSGEDLGDLKDTLTGQALTLFMPAQKPGGQDPIVAVWNEEGHVDWYQIDDRLFRTLEGLDLVQLGPFMEWAFAKPARVFRLGTTGLRASFSLVTNPLRDFQTFYLNSQARRGEPASMLAAWAKQMGNAFVNAVSGGKVKDKSAEVWRDLGGQMAQTLGQDIPHTRRAARQLFQGRVERVLHPGNIYDGIRELLQFPETATRAAEIEYVAKQIGWSPGQPMTFKQSLQLLRAGKQVTTDFSAAGSFARTMNQIVPFYNAAIQGPRATVRAARRNPALFAVRAAQLVAASLGLWWLHKDEDWYREKSAKDKFAFWYFTFGTGKNAELVKIPRTPEIGAISGIAEALADSWYREDPKAAREFFGAALESMNPVSLPPLVREGYEQAANKDSYTDKPIVSQSLSEQPAAEQFNEYTTSASVALGDLFDVSPLRIDHAIRGLGGPAATDILSLLGLGAPGRERESELADTPIAGRLFERGGPMGTRPESFEKLYEQLDLANQKHNSVRDPETPQERQSRLQLEDAAKAVSALTFVRGHTESAQKRRELTAKALDIAKRALEAVPARPYFQLQRKQAEAQKAAVK